MRFAGVITAAGLSSRMGGFKPLMELNGFPMIAMTVQSMRNAGILDITVVTGYRAREVEKVLRPLNVTITENKEYASTDMLTSVKMGLAGILDVDGVFLLPGDIPLTAPSSFRKITEKIPLVLPKTQVLIPTMAGRRTHPPFLFPKGIKSVLEYQGDGGLRGVWRSLPVEELEIEDEGSLKDADFRTDFEGLQTYARQHKGISGEICESIYEEICLPEDIRAHCLAAGNLAGWMAEQLTAHGAFLDVELCRSGGYLYGIWGRRSDHAKIGGAFLREKGYLALAKIMEAGLEKRPKTICRESVIVWLADKLIQSPERMHPEDICSRLTEEFQTITGKRLCAYDRDI